MQSISTHYFMHANNRLLDKIRGAIAKRFEIGENMDVLNLHTAQFT